METELWRVPMTPEGRETLEGLAREYEAGGQVHELGCTLSRLAHFYKHMGTGREDVPAWSAAAAAGLRAVELLRQTDDKAELAQALRHAALPFIEGLDKDKLLEEAQEISREIGDLSAEGWALYGMSGPMNPSANDLLDKARTCFQQSGDLRGLAVVDQRLAVQQRDFQRFLSAAEKFEAAGAVKDAERAYVMATVFCREELSAEEVEALLLKALAIAERREDIDSQLNTLKMLVRTASKSGRKDAAKQYRAKARSLRKT